MKKAVPGLFISDAEILGQCDEVIGTEVIAGLDANLDTQHKATMPAGKRSRSQVVRWLTARGLVTANDQT